MRNFIINHIIILVPITMLAYANLMLKWQVGKLPPVHDSRGFLDYILAAISNIWILSVVIATGAAGVLWSFALNKFPISYAYPFISITFAMVVVGGTVFFGEKLSLQSIVGLLFILIGLVLITNEATR